MVTPGIERRTLGIPKKGVHLSWVTAATPTHLPLVQMPSSHGEGGQTGAWEPQEPTPPQRHREGLVPLSWPLCPREPWGGGLPSWPASFIHCMAEVLTLTSKTKIFLYTTLETHSLGHEGLGLYSQAW